MWDRGRPRAESNRGAESVAGDPRLRVAVLGPLALRRDGRPDAPTGARQRALLGLLAARAGHAVPREAIIDLLWPRNPPKSAPAMVRAYIGELRSRLGDDDPLSRLLVGDEHGYRLRLTGQQLDLLEFTDLTARARGAVLAGSPTAACQWYERAAGVWRGEPLADVELLRGHPAVASLARRRAAVLLGYAEAAAAAGQHERVIPHLNQLAGRDRLDERVHARLMIALAGAGQRAAALRVFEQLRQRLDAELGVRPGAELAGAYAAVLRSPADVGSPPPPPPRRPLPPPRQLPPPAPHFVGRAGQLKELSELLDQTGGPGAAAAVSSSPAPPGSARPRWRSTGLIRSPAASRTASCT